MRIAELKKEDILEIRNKLVEDVLLPDCVIDKVEEMRPAYTIFDKGRVILCCGAVSINGIWEIWSLYNKEVSCFSRCRAIIMMKDKIDEIGGKCRFGISQNLKGGRKYAEFIGGKFIGLERSRLFPDKFEFIYEVG
jgi:hypothetical protein